MALDDGLNVILRGVRGDVTIKDTTEDEVLTVGSPAEAGDCRVEGTACTPLWQVSGEVGDKLGLPLKELQGVKLFALEKFFEAWRGAEKAARRGDIQDMEDFLYNYFSHHREVWRPDDRFIASAADLMTQPMLDAYESAYRKKVRAVYAEAEKESPNVRKMVIALMDAQHYGRAAAGTMYPDQAPLNVAELRENPKVQGILQRAYEDAKKRAIAFERKIGDARGAGDERTAVKSQYLLGDTLRRINLLASAGQLDTSADHELLGRLRASCGPIGCPQPSFP